MRTLNVVCYCDGRPGHEKQSRAVLSELKALTPLSVVSLKLGETAGIKRLFYGVKSLFIVSEGVKSLLPKFVDLIIGTGSSTHLPMVGLKRRTGAKLVTCMTPDLWLMPWIDLCIVPRHDRPPRREKYFATFGPPCLVLDRRHHEMSKALVLAGGVDVNSHHWNTADFISRVDKLIDRQPDVTWTISSSPRTPSDTVESLHSLAQHHPNVEFINAGETPSGWIESAYETHAQVWVTADSVSMIYEALTAGCQVGVLPVAWCRSTNKFQNSIDDLKKRGMVTDFEQWIKGVPLQEASKQLNEAARCAEEIVKRWWPERFV